MSPCQVVDECVCVCVSRHILFFIVFFWKFGSKEIQKSRRRRKKNVGQRLGRDSYNTCANTQWESYVYLQKTACTFRFIWTSVRKTCVICVVTYQVPGSNLLSFSIGIRFWPYAVRSLNICVKQKQACLGVAAIGSLKEKWKENVFVFFLRKRLIIVDLLE